MDADMEGPSKRRLVAELVPKPVTPEVCSICVCVYLTSVHVRGQGSEEPKVPQETR